MTCPGGAQVNKNNRPPCYVKGRNLMKLFRSMLVVWLTVLVATLVGCGGGGGGDAPATTDPVVATTSFPLRAAFDGFARNAHSWQFTGSGTSQGRTVSASGTLTWGSYVATSYQGSPALSRTITVIGTQINGGVTTPLTQAETTFYDLNRNEIGFEGGNYTFLTSSTHLPTVAKINDTGILAIGNIYTSYSNRTLLGTMTASWVLQQNTSTSGLFKLIMTKKDQFENIINQNIETYRISSTGDISLLYETSTSEDSNVRIDYK